MGLLTRCIGGPQQAHGVRSEAEYRRTAKAFLLRHGVKPMLVERDDRPTAYISDGRWVIDCDCGNGPSGSPDWGIAICYECGSVYRPLFPVDLTDVEMVLLARPRASNRHYHPDRESIADLRRENRAHGLGGD